VPSISKAPSRRVRATSRSALARLEWENVERRRTTDTLRRTQDVSRVLSAELSLANVVQTVTDAATALTGAEAGAFFYSSGAPRRATYSASVVSDNVPSLPRSLAGALPGAVSTRRSATSRSPAARI
jgi:hypothetical protein